MRSVKSMFFLFPSFVRHFTFVKIERVCYPINEINLTSPEAQSNTQYLQQDIDYQLSSGSVDSYRLLPLLWTFLEDFGNIHFWKRNLETKAGN